MKVVASLFGDGGESGVRFTTLREREIVMVSSLEFRVQCTKDLSVNHCSKCLKSAIRDIPCCCYASVGARVLSRSCYLRYEFYTFYDGASSEATGSSTGKNKGKDGTSKIWMITCIIAAAGLAVIVFGTSDKNPEDFPYIDLGSLCVATNNFSYSNKLGQGGLGPVYKGILSDGQEVAIKRLSASSEQGTDEFINEVQLIMKLQHKKGNINLVFLFNRHQLHKGNRGS
ncbi:hypothetical protein RIF29_27397 [Crotalaria pallida]|uniref:Uncharacterized protein n=1 Tax=Crotalaria pallida TaxID=3830 RepID=A0AAN9EW74_CROPI